MWKIKFSWETIRMSPLARFSACLYFIKNLRSILFSFWEKKGKPPSSLNHVIYGRPVVAMTTKIRFLRGAILLLLRPQFLAVTFWGIFELIINESGGTRCTRSYHSPALLALAPLARSCSPLSPGKACGRGRGAINVCRIQCKIF